MQIPHWITHLRLFVLRRSWSGRQPPVLLVGAPRTGSSFLVRALMNGAGFSGFAEGHITPLMATLDQAVCDYYDRMRRMGMLDIPENTIAKIPQDLLRARITQVFERINRELFPRGSRWLDKTVNAEAIAALPHLQKIWPGTKILYLTRDGVDNVVSAQKYFGFGLDVACHNWASCGRAWDEVKPLLEPGSYLTVDQNRLADQPLAVANEVAQHLQLPGWRADRFIRNVMKFTPDWRQARPVRAALTELTWPPADRRTFLTVCGDQMVAQGYASLTEVEQALKACAAE